MTAEHEPNRSLELKDTWDGPWPATRAVPMSFFRTPLVNNIDELDADVAFLGVPYDQGTMPGPGPGSGPTASATSTASMTTWTPSRTRRPRATSISTGRR